MTSTTADLLDRTVDRLADRIDPTPGPKQGWNVTGHRPGLVVDTSETLVRLTVRTAQGSGKRTARGG